VDFPTEFVTEGLARLEIPAVPRRQGPGTRTDVPFFNPTMAVNRDLTILALRGIGGGNLLDGLTGVGALAARVEPECPGWFVTATDGWEAAVQLARRNAPRAEVLRHGLHRGPPPGEFTHIDIDPFGSPAPFVPAVMGVPTLRTLSVTATDTGALCGVFPEACARRYGVAVERTAFLKETGLRVMLSYLARCAEDRGRGIRPLLGVAAEHFLKVIVQVTAEPGPPLGHLTITTRGEPRWTSEGFGPLWAGPLFDEAFLRGVTPPEWMGHRTATLWYRLVEEASAPPFYWTTSGISQQAKTEPPRLTAILETLRSAGFTATRTHLAPDGFRTDADLDSILRVAWGPKAASSSAASPGRASPPPSGP